MDVFNFPKQWILACLTFGTFLHFLLGGRKVRSESNRDSKILHFLLVGLVFFMLTSSIFTNTSLERSIYGYPGRANGLLTFISIFILIYTGSSIVLSESFHVRLRNRLLLIFGIFSAYSFIQFMNVDPVPWNNPYNRVIGTLGNPNFSGAFLGVAAAVVLICAYGGRQKFDLRYLLFSSFLAALSVTTGSVQAFGIFLVGVSIQLMAYLYHRLNIKTFVALSAGLASLGILTIVSFLGFGPFGKLLFQYTLRLRLEYWRVGLEIAQNSPLTGIGPDSYVEGFRLFRGVDFVQKYSQAVIADSAHNVPINFMANYGIPAFLFFLSILTLVSVKSIKILFSSEALNPAAKMLAMAWILLLVQSLFSLEQIGLNVFQWCCGALLLNRQIVASRLSGTNRKVQNLRSKLGVVENLRTEIATLAIIFSMILSWNLVKQEIDIQKLAKTTTGTKLSEPEFEEKLSIFNSFSRVEIRRAIYISEFLIRVEKYDDAQLLLEDLIKKDPDAYEALEQLARLARFKSNLELEIDYRKRIEIVDPFNYENLLSIARSLKETGKSFEARRYTEKVLAISRDMGVNESATAILNSKN